MAVAAGAAAGLGLVDAYRHLELVALDAYRRLELVPLDRRPRFVGVACHVQRVAFASFHCPASDSLSMDVFGPNYLSNKTNY